MDLDAIIDDLNGFLTESRPQKIEEIAPDVRTNDEERVISLSREVISEVLSNIEENVSSDVLARILIEASHVTGEVSLRVAEEIVLFFESVASESSRLLTELHDASACLDDEEDADDEDYIEIDVEEWIEEAKGRMTAKMGAASKKWTFEITNARITSKSAATNWSHIAADLHVKDERGDEANYRIYSVRDKIDGKITLKPEGKQPTSFVMVKPGDIQKTKQPLFQSEKFIGPGGFLRDLFVKAARDAGVYGVARA